MFPRWHRRLQPNSLGCGFVLIVFSAVCASAGSAGEPVSDVPPNAAELTVPSAQRGYEILRTRAFLPDDFDQQVFDQLWNTWPEPARSEARNADLAERRRLTRARYGLTNVPEEIDPGGAGIGYVPTATGFAMNCFTCHAGKVAGQVIPGLANSRLALQSLTEDVRLTKLSQRKPLSHMDLGSLKIPLNMTDGTTNSVIFGVVLGALRDADMRVDTKRQMPRLVHHDVDAPPWWNVSKKSALYCDAFAPVNHRILMQFMLIPQNGPQTVYSWEDDFRHILAYIQSLQPPKYPFAIDQELAAEGKGLFQRHCAECHGSYGPEGKYPQKVIPIDEIGTDPLRFRALTPSYRQSLRESWLSFYGRDPVETEPVGYVAPPLNGIWASAPYFHNGSVPTLWHVLHPEQRPNVWKSSPERYDTIRVGLSIEMWETRPEGIERAAEARTYFDTSLPGKSAAGHDFPNVLTEPEKRAVLEYLKCL